MARMKKARNTSSSGAFAAGEDTRMLRCFLTSVLTLEECEIDGGCRGALK